MKIKLLWTPQAREDLLDVYLTIGLDKPGPVHSVEIVRIVDGRRDLTGLFDAES